MDKSIKVNGDDVKIFNEDGFESVEPFALQFDGVSPLVTPSISIDPEYGHILKWGEASQQPLIIRTKVLKPPTPPTT